MTMNHQLSEWQVNFLREAMEVTPEDVADQRGVGKKEALGSNGIIQIKYLIWSSTCILILILG